MSAFERLPDGGDAYVRVYHYEIIGQARIGMRL
jgi:hypothetical protein